MVRYRRMGGFMRQTLCGVLLIKQIKHRVELAFFDLKIVILYIGYQLGKIRLFRQFIAIGHDAQMSLGA